MASPSARGILTTAGPAMSARIGRLTGGSVARMADVPARRRQRRAEAVGSGSPNLRRMASSAAALASDSEPDHPGASSSPIPRDSRSRSAQSSYYAHAKGKGLSTLTGDEAADYLSHLLELPPSRAFPPALALRVLTHKSYTGAQLLGAGHRYRSASGPEGTPEHASSSAHNTRLAFLGKRAFSAYFLMFVHRMAMQSPRGKAGLNLGDVQERTENLAHSLNLGREIGQRWELDSVMRWTSAWNIADGQESGSFRAQGDTVQAVLGATMMQFGSPAAHRLFHTSIFPYLSQQLRSEELREAAEATRRSMLGELHGKIVAA